jgi:ribonuclease HI
MTTPTPLPDDMPLVEMFTDGACSGNPGPGGWGCLIRSGRHVKELSGGAPNTTNNRMELQAPAEGLKALTRPCRVTIYSDSQYVVKGMTEWLAGWKRKGWKNAQGKPVENREYWEALAEAAKPHHVTWQWVKGHAGHPENERVDALAVAAIPKS